MININIIKLYSHNSFINLEEIKPESKIKDISILHVSD